MFSICKKLMSTGNITCFIFLYLKYCKGFSNKNTTLPTYDALCMFISLLINLCSFNLVCFSFEMRGKNIFNNFLCILISYSRELKPKKSRRLRFFYRFNCCVAHKEKKLNICWFTFKLSMSVIYSEYMACTSYFAQQKFERESCRSEINWKTSNRKITFCGWRKNNVRITIDSTAVNQPINPFVRFLWLSLLPARSVAIKMQNLSIWKCFCPPRCL